MGVILEMAPVVNVNGGSTDLTEVNEKIDANRLTIAALEKQVELLAKELSKVDIEYLD